jgi:hypothetical protein
LKDVQTGNCNPDILGDSNDYFSRRKISEEDLNCQGSDSMKNSRASSQEKSQNTDMKEDYLADSSFLESSENFVIDSCG